MGEPLYGPAVDIWATGCVYGECMTGEPLWPGTTDLDQLVLIRQTLGEIPARYLAFFDENPFFSGAALGEIPQPVYLAIETERGLVYSHIELEFDCTLLYSKNF